MKLNRDQKRIIAEVLGQLSVAWFTVGVITPLLSKYLDSKELLRSTIFGFVGFAIFLTMNKLRNI